MLTLKHCFDVLLRRVLPPAPPPDNADLGTLFARCPDGGTQEEMLLWLESLLAWLEKPIGCEQAVDRPSPEIRLRFLLFWLDQHRPAANALADLMSTWVQRAHWTQLFAGTGLPRETDFLGEISGRLGRKLLPAAPDGDSGEWLMEQLLADPARRRWLSNLPDPLIVSLGTLLLRRPDARASLRQEIKAALRVLAIQLTAAAYQPQIRQRLPQRRVSRSVFANLTPDLEQMFSQMERRYGPEEALAQNANLVRARLAMCHGWLLAAQDSLGQRGVSVALVYRIERMQAQIGRLEMLLTLLLDHSPGNALAFLLHNLDRQDEQHSIRGLLGETLALLARSVVERNGRFGQHYIARGRAGVQAMWHKGLRGGYLTALTVHAKHAIAGLMLPKFFEGLAASLNYALSFALIQACQGTLATKQPALTAAALADQMGGDARSRGGLASEIRHVLRSQSAAILGNMAGVAPVALLLAGLAYWLPGHLAMPRTEALSILHAHTLLGPTPLFAAFTGLLLFSASLIAGWIDNLFALHRVRTAIACHPRLLARFGLRRTERLAHLTATHAPELASNIALGFMLGMIPAFAAFMGLPLEVRHITLATGTLTLALLTLGSECLRLAEFWQAIAGLISIAVLNLLTSFGCALSFALLARRLGVIDLRRMLADSLERLLHRPLLPRPAIAKE